jgi:hypothetical protein
MGGSVDNAAGDRILAWLVSRGRSSDDNHLYAAGAYLSAAWVGSLTHRDVRVFQGSVIPAFSPGRRQRRRRAPGAAR